MNGWIFVHDLSPVLFQIGPVAVRWYGLMYLITFFSGYWYYTREARRPGALMEPEEVSNMLVYGVLGVIVGGRIGWVIFYGGLSYLENPLRILKVWEGGLSFHGGLLGVALAIVLFARAQKISIAALADFIGPWVPVGVFLVRMGNFINAELFGAPTDQSWGVKFYSDRLCRDPSSGLFNPDLSTCLARHPSQLYEALLEGVVLFVVLMWLKGRVRITGIMPAVFLLGYGLVRFAVEFIRLPDADIGYLAFGFVTMGQVLSLPMILVGGGWTAWLMLRNREAGAS